MSDLKTLLAPISRLVPELDLADTQGSEAILNERFPPTGADVASISAAAREALTAGTICHRGEEGMKFSRVSKPEVDPGGCSIDAVFMNSSQGPDHTHTTGEVCLCLPLEGSPSFEERTDTWMVLPPGSRHVPTVKDGAMLIIYWWPRGQAEWH